MTSGGQETRVRHALFIPWLFSKPPNRMRGSNIFRTIERLMILYGYADAARRLPH